MAKKQKQPNRLNLAFFAKLSSLVCLVLCLWCAGPVQAQKFEDPKFSSLSQRQFDIPFEYENNFIIVKVVFNNVFPLRFIFDTGAEYTILSKREITDLLQVDYHKRFTLQGADMRTDLYAYLARGITMNIGNTRHVNRSILVLEEDYFRFEEFSGIQVHGILGADLFKRFVVKINYKRRIITLTDPDSFRPARTGSTFEYPLEMQRNKPYISVPIRLAGDTIIRTKLLLDTGASMSLLLYTNTHPGLHLPEKTIPSNIGMGLGGFLQGYLGRIPRLEIQDVAFHEVITNFQELPPGVDTANMVRRNGILGNPILSRFILTLDYPRERLYLTPVPGYRSKFEYDRSGLVIIASGPNLTKFTVFDVIPNSPAARAGLRRGDELRRINGFPAVLMSLAEVNARFRRKPGTKIRLQVERNNVRMEKRFQLEQLI